MSQPGITTSQLPTAPTATTASRRGRGCLIWIGRILGGLAILLAGLLLCGFIYEAVHRREESPQHRVGAAGCGGQGNFNDG